jgi:pimeloyl-ACP methyl ester carboxylesterase
MYSGCSAEYTKIAAEDFRRAYLAALGGLAELDLRPRLSRVSVPTLVACGSNDRVNIRLSRELAAGIRDAEVQIVSGATHLWNLQQPTRSTRPSRAFLQRTAA